MMVSILFSFANRSFADSSKTHPSSTLHGPALPVSSQVIFPPASFQMEKMSTMPRSMASPICARPPRSWKDGAVALQ